MKRKKKRIKKEKIVRNRYRSSFITTMISISLVLFLLGIIGMLLLTKESVSVIVKEKIGFDIYLNEDVREADILRIQKHLDAKPYVRETEYISKEEAVEIMKEEYGDDYTEAEVEKLAN